MNDHTLNPEGGHSPQFQTSLPGARDPQAPPQGVLWLKVEALVTAVNPPQGARPQPYNVLKCYRWNGANTPPAGGRRYMVKPALGNNPHAVGDVLYATPVPGGTDWAYHGSTSGRTYRATHVELLTLPQGGLKYQHLTVVDDLGTVSWDYSRFH